MAHSGAVVVPPHHAIPSSPEERAAEKERLMTQRVSRTTTRDVNPAKGAKDAPALSHGEARVRGSTQSHQKFVFPDPVAFRYLEEDPATVVLARWKRLFGYEMYVVEQWACSRTHPTFLICTYTGDNERSIVVNVLGVPSDKSSWSPRLKLYFDALEQFHAKDMDTPFGTILVTNLSAFPPALTVINVPDGDVKKHREDFIVNENLKRMGCTGRAAINLQPPPSSTVQKFHQVYHTSESAGIYQAVMELVKLCQTALLIYGKLQEAYVDGLLCDITETAVRDWWAEIGGEFFNMEPSDGILGPTTVAALLGLLMGAWNRMKAHGVTVPKDVLDASSMKRSISSFQKTLKIERSRRLDRDTLDRLHRATAKSAASEGWGVPRAVKSTVADITGKGGEMVMGIVGGREKAGISEVETWDIERFRQLVVGAKMKWLWQGKQKPMDVFTKTTDELNGKVFSTDDQGGFIWTGKSESTNDFLLERTDTMSTMAPHDGRSGFGRFKGAVGGLKTHSDRRRDEEDHHGLSDSQGPPTSHLRHAERPTTPDLPGRTRAPTGPPLDLALAEAPVTPQNKQRKQQEDGPPSGRQSLESFRGYREQLRPQGPAESPRKRKIRMDMTQLREDFKAEIYQNFSSSFKYDGPQSKALRRSQSAVQLIDPGPLGADFPRQNRLNRQLSFSMVENAVLDFGDPVTEDEPNIQREKQGVLSEMAYRDALTASAQKRARKISHLQRGFIPFTESKVAHVENLDRDAQRHLEELNNLYYQKLEEYQTLRATSSDVVGQEKRTLTDGLRRVEMLGAKLDYELNALQSRMQEVDDGVEEFERSVITIEARVKELAGAEDRESNSWFQMLLSMLSWKQ